jgi:hypothetical protein
LAPPTTGMVVIAMTLGRDSTRVQYIYPIPICAESGFAIGNSNSKL